MAFLKSATVPEPGYVVHGDGVVLRVPTMADYHAWAALRAESRAFLTPWEPSWARDELSRTAFRRRLRHYHRDFRDGTGYAFFVHGTRDHDDRLLGGISLTNVRRGATQACSLGYWIGARFAGKGYMTEAVRAIIPFAFDVLRLHRIEAACLPANTASIAVLKKTGFRREGLARGYLRIDGRWQDHILFALLGDDPRM